MSHSRGNSTFNQTSSSIPPAASASAANANYASYPAGAGQRGGRYKAITRELLLAVCRKHFVQRVVGGASMSGTMRESKKEKGDPGWADQEREHYMNLQTKLESLDHYLKRATHLQLDNMKLTHTHVQPELAVAIGQSPNDHSFSLAKSCRVMYLHDNQLGPYIDDFSFAKTALSHLYLQNNQIARMTNLLSLQNLEKLYLGSNRIDMLEGFAREELPEYQEEMQRMQEQMEEEDAQNGGEISERPPRSLPPPQPFYLIELHLDSQRLPQGVSFQLSIPSIQALSHSLTILTLSHNQMDSDSILPLSLLSKLRELNLSSNAISNLKIVAEMCSYLSDLNNLDLRENPINSGPNAQSVPHKKYRDKIIMSSRNITLLDEKPVPDNQREFLQGLAAQKRLKRAQAAGGGSGPQEPRKLSPEEEKFAKLHAPPQFPYQPKVLTLRSSSLPNSIPVGAIGGMGAGARHTLQGGSAAAPVGNFAPYIPFYQQGSASSPFLDDDPNFGDGTGDGEDGGASSSAPQQNVIDESLDPLPNQPFTGDTKRLNYLLQSRGLVSAFAASKLNDGSASDFAGDGSLSLEDGNVESARIRRATMNALSSAQNGWDGGRTSVSKSPAAVRLADSASKSKIR